jgi:glycosyltransferase involved in cell wall biosynthesis
LFLLAALFDFVRFFGFVMVRPRLIVHVHTSSYLGWWRSALYILISRVLGKRTVLHVHNAIDRFYFQDSGRLGRFLIRRSLRLPDYLITLSDGIKALISDLTPKPIRPIYNGVEVDEFEGSKVYDRPLRILFAGFVGPRKGVPDLLKAIKESGLGSDQIALTIMGAGEVEAMERLAAELGIGDRVRLTGRVSEEEKRGLLRSHHVLALPSHGEGQPIAILEGLASGMAVLSTRVGSIPEVISRENGILVAPGDVGGLAMAVRELYGSIDIQEMGRRNRDYAERCFRFSRVVNDNQEVYRELARV